MKLDIFDYELPQELIAQTPLKDRTASRLMVLDRANNEVAHDCFKNIKQHLKKGDCLVLNNTRVIPARLYGCREGSGGNVEFLLLNRLSTNRWETIVKPGRK